MLKYIAGYIEKEDYDYLMENTVNTSKLLRILVGDYVKDKRNIPKTAPVPVKTMN